MAFGMNKFKNPDYIEGEEQIDEMAQPAFSDEGSVAAGRPGASWSELADQQRADAETAQINANQKRFDDMMAIEIGSKRKIAINQQNRRIDCATAMESALNNGGLSDRSLSDALSMSFGRPTYGGQWINLGDEGTAFVLYGGGRNRQGNAAVVPIAMMNNLQSLQLLQSAKLGDRTQKLRESLYKEVAAKYRPDQLESMGIQNPSAPISTGTTVISGAAMRALRGTPRQRNMEGGHFAADGRGGFTKSYFNRRTGENWEVDYGTRDPNRPAKWKVLESHADYTRYENDLTGEVVKVPKGSSLRVVLRGSSERERVAQIQAQGRAEEQAERKRQFDETLAANKEAKREQMRSQFVGNAVQNITKMLNNSGVAVDKIGDMVQTQLSAMLDQYDKAMGWGNEAQAPAPQGDGTIIGAAGGATGSGGKGEVAQDNNEVRAALLAEKEKRAAKSQGASGGKADGKNPAQKDRGDNNGKQTTISERRKKEYDDGMKEILANAEKMKNDVGWSGMKKSAKDIETYIKREEYMLKERLRKKYNNIQGATK